MALELELKSFADIGLVGPPTAGKSMLMCVLTGASVRVASYAFTTLQPIVGVLRVFEDPEQSDQNILRGPTFVDESRNERERYTALMRSGEERVPEPSDNDLQEVFHFTVADSPGLIDDAATDRGLGHIFLRSIERATGLVCVFDLSGPAPWDDFNVILDELSAYQAGIASRVRCAVANKADLFGKDDEYQRGISKLETLVSAVNRRMEGLPTDVVPVSAKHVQNMEKLVNLFIGCVADGSMGLDNPDRDL